MKDRNTLYRIRQNAGLACAFDSWVPGFQDNYSDDIPIINYAVQVVANAIRAGKTIELNQPDFFGTVEAPFIITPGQSGKVRGDAFEMVCRAILWNCASLIGANPISLGLVPDHVSSQFSVALSDKKLAVLTLGDNYDLKALLTEESATKLGDFETALLKQGTSIRYSTPDIVCIDISNQDADTQAYFDQYIDNLNVKNQLILAQSRTKLEGKVNPSDILFAGGIKTSIRSDRMYQFLYEANSWKFIWSKIFGVPPSSYYVLTSQTFGADPEKLRSVDFSSMSGGVSGAKRAIDGVFQLVTPSDLVGWFVESIKNYSTDAELAGI